MNSKWTKFGLVAVALLVGLMLVASTVSAQGPGNGPQNGGRGRGMGMRGGMGYGIGGPQDSLIAIAAKTLGIEQTALISTLNSGKTIADVAKDKGVALDKIVDAVVADRTENLKAAVTAKRITQEQADAWLAQLKTNVTAQLNAKYTPRGYGMGTGFVDANKDGVCDNCGMNGGARSNTPRGPRGGRR